MLNKSGLFTKLVTMAAAGSFLFGATAFGGESVSYSTDANLNAWAVKASALVSRNMKEPRFSLTQSAEGVAHLRVTIDEDGEILNSSLTKSSGSNSIDRAAKYTLKNIENFPAIPMSQNASSLTFGVRLVYADSEASLAKFNRGLATNVRSEEVIASAGGVDVYSVVGKE